MKLTGNKHYLLLITWLDFGGHGSQVKVTAGHRGGKSIHVNSGASKFLF